MGRAWPMQSENHTGKLRLTLGFWKHKPYSVCLYLHLCWDKQLSAEENAVCFSISAKGQQLQQRGTPFPTFKANTRSVLRLKHLPAMLTWQVRAAVGPLVVQCCGHFTARAFFCLIDYGIEIIWAQCGDVAKPLLRNEALHGVTAMCGQWAELALGNL